MATGPVPFSELGKQVKDLLTKDYNFDHKFIFSVPSSSRMRVTATGVQRDDICTSDISAQYKNGNTTVDVKFDSYSNMSTKVTVNDILASAKATLSFDIPDYNSGKLDVQYRRNHAVIDSGIGLHPTPILEVAATLGNSDLSFGGEFELDTTSSTFTKCNAGIGLNKADFSAALMLMDGGKTLKTSYVHTLNPLNGTAVALELTYGFFSYKNSFTIGCSHSIDPRTRLKARFSSDSKFAILCQREWRPKSLLTISAEYDSKGIIATPKLGLALALNP